MGLLLSCSLVQRKLYGMTGGKRPEWTSAGRRIRWGVWYLLRNWLIRGRRSIGGLIGNRVVKVGCKGRYTCDRMVRTVTASYLYPALFLMIQADVTLFSGINWFLMRVTPMKSGIGATSNQMVRSGGRIIGPTASKVTSALPLLTLPGCSATILTMKNARGEPSRVRPSWKPSK